MNVSTVSFVMAILWSLSIGMVQSQNQQWIDTTGYFFPNEWAPGFKSKLMNASDQQVVISILGDSVSEGMNAYDISVFPSATHYVGRLRTRLQAMYGDGGSGFVTAANGKAIPSPYTSNINRSSCSVSGTWSTINGEGPAGYIINTQTTGSSATFIVRGSTIDVVYVSASNTGLFTVQIDNYAPITINSYNGTKNDIVVYTSTNHSTGSHTVIVTHTDTRTSIYTAVAGARGTNPTGLIIDNYSIIGQPISHFINRNSVQYAAARDCSGGSYMFTADLVIIALGLNDAGGKTGFVPTDSAYASSLFLITEAFKNKASNGTALDAQRTDLLFLSFLIGLYQSVSNTGAPSYPSLIDKQLELVEYYQPQNNTAGMIKLGEFWDNNYKVFAMVDGWGNSDYSGNPGTDIVHPGDIGHQLYANKILDILTGVVSTD